MAKVEGQGKPRRVRIPDHLDRPNEIGPAVRKLLVDEARAENLRRYGENARQLREAAGVRAILDEAHRVWAGIDRGTHIASDLDEVLDPRRWRVSANEDDRATWRSRVEDSERLTRFGFELGLKPDSDALEGGK